MKSAVQEDLNKYKFKVGSRVRMSQTDIEGIVNNIRYFDFIEIGRFEYFRDLGISYGKLREFGTGMALADISCTFLAPLYFDEEIDIYVRVGYLGDSSFHVNYLIFVPERESLVAEGRTVSVFLDPKTRRPGKMPEEFRRMILDFEGIDNVKTKG
jgi:acyl-CoA thioester hydrolase